MNKSWIAVLNFFLLFSMAQQIKAIPNHMEGIRQDRPGTTDTLLRNLLNRYPQFFEQILKNKTENRLQIIYTQVDRDKKGRPRFSDHYFNVDNEQYFYPASTVKLPVAILALQKLNELEIQGLDKNATMITGAEGAFQTAVYNDPSVKDGRPSIAHYIKKILLVSDNDAYNRLYEFLGQEYINRSLHAMGYSSIQIIHRLEIFLSEEENRFTNPVSFYDSLGNLLYKKESQRSGLNYSVRNTKLGKGFYRAGQLINEPFDFSMKNRMVLPELHSIVRSIIFPGAVPERQRFNLTREDYDFLRKYMSMVPRESTDPLYPVNEYHDAYVKFILFGDEKEARINQVRSFNKVGDAYGFLTDATYIVDLEKNIEFFVSAVIYCNSDGVLNDNNYDYKTVGLPFMKNLGEVLYEYELRRGRNYVPDLSGFRFEYDQ